MTGLPFERYHFRGGRASTFRARDVGRGGAVRDETLRRIDLEIDVVEVRAIRTIRTDRVDTRIIARSPDVLNQLATSALSASSRASIGEQTVPMLQARIARSHLLARRREA